MIVEDINSIYGTSNVSKAQIYTLAGYQESNALDVCVCVCVQIQKHLSSLSFIFSGVVKRDFDKPDRDASLLIAS